MICTLCPRRCAALRDASHGEGWCRLPQGLRVAHMGDVGEMPAPEVLEQLKGVDAVMLPVGGFYTVGPQEAKTIADAVEAKVVIPMHYRSDSFGFDVLGPVEDYLDLDSHWMRFDTDTIEIHKDMHHSVAVLTYPS